MISSARCREVVEVVGDGEVIARECVECPRGDRQQLIRGILDRGVMPALDHGVQHPAHR